MSEKYSGRNLEYPTTGAKAIVYPSPSPSTVHSLYASSLLVSTWRSNFLFRVYFVWSVACIPQYLPTSIPRTTIPIPSSTELSTMCFGDGTKHKLHIRERSKDEYRGTRHGTNRSYYPPQYYARPPIGPYMGGRHHHAIHHRQHHHHHHFGHDHRHSYALPSRHALVPAGINCGPHRYHAGGIASMPSRSAMVSRICLPFFVCHAPHRLLLDRSIITRGELGR